MKHDMNVVDEFHVNPVRHLWENRRFLRNLVMATEDQRRPTLQCNRVNAIGSCL